MKEKTSLTPPLYIEDITDPSRDILSLFNEFAHLPDCVFLDSADPRSPHSTHSYLALRPFAQVIAKDGQCQYRFQNSTEKINSPLFEFLEDIMRRYKQPQSNRDFPFLGGAIGYFTYEASEHSLPYQHPRHSSSIPEAIIGFYNKLIIKNHEKTLCIGCTSPTRAQRNAATL